MPSLRRSTGHEGFGAAAEIAEAVRSGKVKVREVVEAALKRIEIHNPTLGAFTDLTARRALEQADLVDGKIANTLDPGPLAGVPFAVKQPVRHQGRGDARRLEDQSRQPAGGA